MSLDNRRQFLRSASAVAALATLPASIRRALAVPAFTKAGAIEDIKHVVILMQENRSFDHYFGTMKGVRGFGDRHPIPLESGKPVWHQSDGVREILPFHLDTKITSALRVPGTPHSFSDSQAAWNQGKFGFWPKFKTQYSMGHYKRDDIPFQFALAEGFTICDAYHCSVTTGTDPNRIVFWSGSNFNPELRARGENCTDADSEPNNLRCWVKGALPTPGYVYQGSAFKWATIPDVLQRAGITWRFYQDPNDNWTGAMHGCLAFESFRSAGKESPQYRNGMSHWSLEQLAQDVQNDALPQVSWVLPPADWSEHPSRSTPLQGAEFTAQVLNTLTANPEVWSKTVFLLTFDENDGQFDHVPPPAVPSFNRDGSIAGKSTLDLRGEYFAGAEGEYVKPEDTISGAVRPWGLGPRVPLYIISPWSKGGWVNSQVFDHTSVGQFLEKRFGIKIPGISPWHRVVCGDLTSAFDFVSPNDPAFLRLPDVTGSVAVVAEHSKRPKPIPPDLPRAPFQEPGIRPSRAL
ncbi:MAG TPA: phospholipase C, phosphocholine-specific, partial [Bryobacteraceae bacterium]|nr:phospholipase C, phosphocholine-specific [Bryobacteraceae bacterium]